MIWFSSWHWSYCSEQSQTLPSSTVKVLITLSWAHTHTHAHKWKSKVIPPWINLCRWSNELSWWQGTIISSKEVKAADWRMKNMLCGGWETPRQDRETPRHQLQLSIYDKVISSSSSSLFSLWACVSVFLRPCLWGGGSLGRPGAKVMICPSSFSPWPQLIRLWKPWDARGREEEI